MMRIASIQSLLSMYISTSNERHVDLYLHLITSKVGIKYTMSIETVPTSVALKFLQQPFLFTLCT